MAEKLKMNAGRWWKFSSYEIHEFSSHGFGKKYIRPAREGTLSEYDLWKGWENGRPLRQGDVSPYRDLLDTIAELKCRSQENRSLKKLPSRRWRDCSETLEPESEAALLKWCEHYGLLGLLPHQTHQITLAPRSRPLTDEERRLWEATKGSENCPTKVDEQLQYSRTARGWLEIRRPRMLPSRPFWPSGFLRRDAFGTSLEWNSLTSLLWAFPTIPKPDESDIWRDFQYPAPLSPEFWQIYSEPVSEFLDAAGRLHDAIEAMTIGGPRPRVGSKKDQVLLRGMTYLEGLLDPVSLSYEFVPGKGIWPRHIAGSLLATLATMAMMDRPQGRFSQCQKCGNLFPSGAYPQARYCSKQCRWATQRKAYRDRKKKGEG